ncbi:MAG: hypothetical protein DIZ80_06950 [endosymbiont of Galathealinum brachiosum]|uniref:Filamentous haemagglutinin FhaB/tRNA nuclease CdiA-like TPS domain-containing protein n=1 Tax=endosymbiont of Galathealinum brachiosum TaxID=2200906 RepID=A0A370DI74_9GAMM|nr:MAG: hypothetical protein DIZ80_06950 [endosymbiont of Galathealinum brachiosum]
MAVKIKNELSDVSKKLNSCFRNRIRLGMSGYSQLFFYSFLFCYPSFSYAGPTGGNVVGGAGSIIQAGLTTNINQLSSSLAIDWQSFNVSSNEIVNFLQPNSSSIALNRIIGGSASEILGQINANGRIALVNPNGVFFGSGSSVNVGGLIASGLDIKSSDFMNGDYVFSSIDGTTGAVINGGILNASLGGRFENEEYIAGTIGNGNISLVGKQVTNTGFISANLGAINLAAGKEAILTFDNEGLMGVKITKTILQDELGVDPAILNEGEITAEAGRVLLTASQSQDVFSQAVNSNGIEQATSVVVNDDGSFTLGTGADVVNAGVIDVSSLANKAGQIVLLGENITNSGNVLADSSNLNAGDIELHSSDKTLLTGTSIVSASSVKQDGGNVKVLGNRIALLDQSSVKVNAANDAGEILIGGDYKGENTQIRNSSGVYISQNSELKADSLSSGDGGRIIVWADESAKIFGQISAHGGEVSGNGGFVETSAKVVDLDLNVNVGAENGEAGTWLIDPYNIIIQSVCGACTETLDDTSDATFDHIFSPDATDSVLTTATLLATFLDGANVLVETTTGGSVEPTGGNITLASELDIQLAPEVGPYSLTLRADHDININESILDSNRASLDILNLSLIANSNGIDGGDVNIAAIVSTYDGSFSATGDNIDIQTAGAVLTLNGDITLTANTGGSITVDGAVTTTGGAFTAEVAAAATGVSFSNIATITTAGGAVDITVDGDIDINGNINTSGGAFSADNSTTFDNSDSSGDILAGSGAVSIAASGDTVGDGTGVGINLGRILTTTTLDVTANAGSITQTASTTNELEITGVTTLSSSRDITLNNTENHFSTVTTTTARDLTLVDLGSIILGASTVTRDLAVTASGSGNISQSGALVVTGTSVFTATSNDIALEDVTNEFTGTVSTSTAADSFRLSNNRDLEVGNISVTDTSGASIRLRAVGTGSDITQASGTSIDMGNGGFADLIATDDIITLDSNANDFYSVQLDANDVVLHETGRIRLSTTNVTNDLTIVAGITSTSNTTAIQDLTDAVISVDGLTSLTARNTTSVNNNVDIQLDSTNADYVSIDIVNADDVVIVDNTDGLAIQGDVRDALLLTANGTVTAANVITNPGALTVAGASTGITVVSGQSIDLSNAGNSFTNDPTFSTSNAGDIADLSLTDITDFTLQDNIAFTNDLTLLAPNVTFNNTTVGNDLTVTATDSNGSINQVSGKSVDVTGLSTLIANATAGIINFGNSGNDFNGAVLSSAQTVTLRDADSIQLGESTIGNGFTVTADDGSITQINTGNGLDVSGLTSLNSTNGHINLTNVTNDFKGSVDIVTSGTDVTSTAVIITDVNDIAITNANIGINDSDFTVNATAINLNGDVSTSDGAATFNAPVVLQSTIAAGNLTTNTINTGTGSLTFQGFVNGNTSREQSLAITAGNVAIGAVGGGVILGDISITSTGDINVGVNAITAQSLNVTASNSFASGDINTSGSSTNALTTTTAEVTINSDTSISTGDITTFGANVPVDTAGLAGGNVTLAANNITLGAIDAHGSSATFSAGTPTFAGGVAGDVSITATELTGPTVAPVVTLNGDINVVNGDAVNAGVVQAGVTKTAQLSLVSTSSAILNINHTTAFTSQVDVTGSAGIDTLNAADINNDWDITGADIGDLNSTLHFDDFENLIGLSGVDTFTFSSSTGTIDGLIDGGTGLDVLTLFSGGSIGTTVQIAGVADQTGNGVLEIDNIETITGNNSNTATDVLLGVDADSNWFINGSGSGSVGDTSLLVDAATATDGVTIFSEFEELTGGTSADTFTVITDTAAGLTLNGGASAGAPQYDTLIGPDGVNTTWLIDSQNGGTLSDTAAITLSVDFTGIENLTAGDGNDTFTFNGGFDVDGSVDAGDGTDDIDLSNLAVVTFNVASGIAGNRTNFEKVTGNGTNSTLIGDSTGGDAYVWSIEDINAGFVNKGDIDQLEFSGFNNLTGSVGNDTFNFIDDNVTQGDITGLINGGASGTNTLNIYTAGNGKAVTVQLEGVAGVSGVTAGDSNLNGFIDVINLTDITANSIFTSNTLRGGDSANNWDITATRIGTVDTSTNFTDFYNLVGGSDVDTFNIGQNGVVSDINGGVDAVIDEIVNQQTSATNWSIVSNTSGNVTNISGVTTFSDVELLTGNNDTLTGPSLVANTWNISGDNAGDVNSAISFTGMTLINGGATDDTFNIADAVTNGNFSGGAAGTDVVSLDTEAGTNLNTNVWDITGSGAGTVKGTIQFQLMESLVGNDGADQFTLSTDQFTGSINGGAGVDNLTASAGDNSWTINATDGGLVTDATSGLAAIYSFVENLIGNSAADQFIVSNTGNVSGTIDGGAGIDTLDLTFKTVDDGVIVNLGSALSTGAPFTGNSEFDVNNIETISAPVLTVVTVGTDLVVSDPVHNTIIGANIDQLWIVDGINQGAVGDSLLIDGGIPSSDTEGITKFTNFDNVTGGTEDDSFRVLDNSSIVTSLSGGDHNIGDTIDLSNQLSVDINIGDGVVGFNDIEGFRGNDTDSILRAKDLDNTWTISGNNDGTVLDSDGVTFSFIDFNILIGGNLEDEFIVEAGGSVEDTNFNNSVTGIQGGAGASVDSLIVEFDGTNSGRVAMFDGEGGNDTVTFRDSATGSTGFDRAVFTPDVSSAPNGIVTYGFENLSGLNNSFDVTYVNAVAVTDNVTANTLIINGSAFNDEISLDSTSYTVDATDTIPGPTTFITVNYTNKTDIEVLAGDGLNDLITLTGNIGTTASDVTLSAETVDNNNAFKVAANNLTLDTVRATSSPLQTNAINLFITNSDASANTIDIVEDNDLALAGLQYTGTLNIDVLNNITQTNALSSSALLNLTSTNGGIDISNVNNTLSGRLNLLATNGTVDLGNNANTNLGNINSTVLTVTSTGDITDSGTLVSDSAVLDSGAASITLDTAANDFNQLSVLNANSISIVDVNDIQLADISMGVGIFELTSVGVTQLGGSSFTQAQPVTGLAGSVAFNAGVGVIALAENNQFAGPVSLNNSGNNNVSITDVDNIVFGNTSVGEGSLTVNAVGISQVSGTSLTQDSDTGLADGTAGDVTLNAGAGSIDLSEAANDFSGFVLINNTGLNNVTITDENKITLGSSTVGGDLRVTAIGDNLPGNERNLGDFEAGDGDIEQDLTGTGITVAGSSVFSVSDSRSSILSAAGNNFNSIGFELTGGVGVLDSVLLVNNSTVDLGDMIIGGHIGVFAGGVITNTSGALQVAGTTVMDASNSSGQLFDVLLNNAGNDFNDLIVNAANDVVVTDINDVNFGDTANLQFNGAAVSDVTTVTGDLTVNAGGSIGDLTGVAINVTGDSQFNATTGNVILDGIVNLNTVGFNAVNATLINSDAIDLTTSSISNAASFTAQAGNITNSGDLTIAGNALFSAANTSDISITNITSGNQLSGDLSFASAGTLNSVTLENTLATNVMALDVNNNLSITSAGELTQGGGFNVGNITTLNAIDATSATQNISLGNFVNNLRDLFVTNANDVTIDNSGNALTISQMNATGIVNIISGALSVITDITAGSITFDSGTGNANFAGDLTSSSGINVTSADLALNGTVTAQSDIVFNSSGAISTNSSSTTTSTAGSITYEAVNDISITTLDAQNGDISVRSTSGRVGANTAATNYIGNLLTIESVGGVGSGTGGVNDLNTQVTDMDILNTGSGDIRIQQNGDVDIHQLRNTVVNGLINIGSNDDYRFDSGSVEVDRSSGTLFMTTSGDFLGNGLLDRDNADITAFNATFISLSGDFGITSRPIVLDVPKDGSVLIDTRRTSFIFFPETPDNLISTGIDVSALGVVSAIAGELQVEVESLGDVDPAIFTDLQNYSLEEISIRMPRDQLFEDELEDYDRL